MNFDTMEGQVTRQGIDLPQSDRLLHPGRYRYREEADQQQAYPRKILHVQAPENKAFGMMPFLSNDHKPERGREATLFPFPGRDFEKFFSYIEPRAAVS
jgi:hypothetical protein